MTDLEQLLKDVAEGRVSPDTAARLLDRPEALAQGLAPSPAGPGATASDELPGPGGGQDPWEAPGSAGASESAPERLVLRVSARGVRLIADPSVATVHVEGGPHRVRQEGAILRVEADTIPPEGDDDGFSLTESPSQWRRWLNRRGVANNIVVRANPALPVEAAVDAGALEITGWRAPMTFSVNAGAVRASDCHGLVDGTVRAGSAKLEVLLPAGHSRVHAEAGSVELRLLKGSDVTIKAQAELGAISMADSLGGAKVAGNGKAEAVVGDGTGSLDLTVTMGSAKVKGA
jgi:hypothetical protein